MAAPRDSEGGETLLEILITLAIMGIAVAAVIGGLTASILVSDAHRKQTTAGSIVRNYAEKVDQYVGNTNNTGYATCGNKSAYSPAAVGLGTIPSGYVASAVSLQYWTGTTWSGTCGNDSGLQLLTVQVASSDSHDAETLSIVLRQPCGPGSDGGGDGEGDGGDGGSCGSQGGGD